MDLKTTLTIISFAISIIAIFISFYFKIKFSEVNRINRFNDNIAEINFLTINYPELVYIYNNDKIEEKRTDVDFCNRMHAFIYLHFNMFENLFIQHLSKKLNNNQIKAWERYIKETFETKLVVEIWEENKYLYDYKFTVYIDKLLKAT